MQSFNFFLDRYNVLLHFRSYSPNNYLLHIPNISFGHLLDGLKVLPEYLLDILRYFYDISWDVVGYPTGISIGSYLSIWDNLGCPQNNMCCVGIKRRYKLGIIWSTDVKLTSSSSKSRIFYVISTKSCWDIKFQL
jgi:hypothetical protein